MARRSEAPRWALLFALVGTAAFWLAVFLEPEATGWGDWQYFHHMWEVGRVGLERHGALPLWDAHHCGGVTLWGNPQAQIYGPLFMLTPLVGSSTVAIKLFVVLHVFAAFHGMVVLARRQGLGDLGAMGAAVAFAGSGYFAWHLAGGHAPFAPFAFTPWLLTAWQRAPREPRQASVVALLLGLTLFEGGVYPFPYFVLLLAFDAVARLRSDGARVIWVGAAAAGIALLICAGRLIPVLQTLAENPRETDLLDRLDLGGLWTMLTLRGEPENPIGAYSWPEYGAYLGPIALLLAAAGLPKAWNRQRVWIVGLVLFALLALGNRGPWSPWRLIHHIPVYDSLRVPSRFMVFVTFYLALLAGLGLDRLAGHVRSEAGARATGAALVLALLAFDLLSVNARVIDRWAGEPITRDAPAERYHLVSTPYNRYAQFPQLGVGTSACYDPMGIPMVGGLRSGDRPQAWLAGDSGEVLRAERGLDRFEASVRLDEPGRLVVNQRGDSGWELEPGSPGAIDRESLRLEVELPAGSHDIALRYRPKRFGLSVGLTLTGLALALLWWLAFTWRGRRRRVSDPTGAW